MSSFNILICGVGNKLKRDDGLGPYIVERLQEQELPANVTALDFGISGFKTALHIGEYDKVIFVDAMQSDKEPGQVSRTTITKEDLADSSALDVFAIGMHESDLEKVLATAAQLDSYPGEVVLIGCQPADLSVGLGLSPIVEQSVDMIITLILNELNKA